MRLTELAQRLDGKLVDDLNGALADPNDPELGPAFFLIEEVDIDGKDLWVFTDIDGVSHHWTSPSVTEANGVLTVTTDDGRRYRCRA